MTRNKKFGLWRGPPTPVATDTVLPARFFDDTPMVRDVVMRWVIRFDDVLDAEQLHSGLNKLLSTASWRRLGGRLRSGKNGKLEVHVPNTFDARRPAVRFSHVSLFADTAIADHPAASRLPQCTQGPSVQQGGASAFRELVGGDGDGDGDGDDTRLPQTLADYVNAEDEPPIALRIISFRDATVVALNFPHVLTDAVGFSALLTAWSEVLAGREAGVARLAEHDPLESITAATTVRGEGDEEEKQEHAALHDLHGRELTGFAMLCFALRFVLDLLFGPAMQTRLVFLPARNVQAMRQQAFDDLAAAGAEVDAATTTATGTTTTMTISTPSFLSDGDVLTAWGARLIARGLGRAAAARPLAVMNVFELRNRLPALFNSSSDNSSGVIAYVQNAFFTADTVLPPAAATATAPLGRIARQLRASLAAQTAAASRVRALVRAQREALERRGRPALFVPSNAVLVPVSNWGRAGLFDAIDFGPAVVRVGEAVELEGAEKKKVVEGAAGRVGKLVFFVAFDACPRPNPTHRNVINIMGRDPGGNYWITGIMSPAAWKCVEEELQRM